MIEPTLMTLMPSRNSLMAPVRASLKRSQLLSHSAAMSGSL